MRLLALLATTLAFAGVARAWHVLPPGAEGWRGRDAIRGMTVGPIESIQQPGRGYGTASSGPLLDHVRAMGANWISLTPFGRVWDLQDTQVAMDFEAPYETNRGDVIRTVRMAHARGLKVLLIPHLWVETTGWRGEMAPTDWDAYQESYRDFVLAWAETAAEAGADAFSIGVECKSWSGRFGRYWRRLIDDVRARFGGWLTYSSNWDEAENVLFWEQLDLIGINAFYPLHGEDGASDADYRAGAEAIVPSVRELAEVHQMPVLFVEVGYTTRADAAVQPWLWPDGMEGVVIDEREQARALQASFDAFLPEPWFAGFFVWRMYAHLDDVSQENLWGFSPHAKQAEPMLEQVWASEFGVETIRWPWDPGFVPDARPALPSLAATFGAPLLRPSPSPAEWMQ